MKQKMTETNVEADSENEVEDALKELFKEYCNGKRITQKDRDSVGEIIDRVVKTTGKTIGQHVMELRGYDEEEIY